MAGDWIKFEKSTLDKPEVLEMAGILEIDPDAVVGKLLRVWNWFDDQSHDGNAPVTVKALLDRYAGVSGFTSAMQEVGWLTIDGDAMYLPNFDRHNGQTAKKRCNTNRRVAKSRSKKLNDNAECNTQSVTSVTPPALQKALPEKRREEKSITLSQRGISPTIDEVMAMVGSTPYPLTQEISNAYWHDREAVGWMKKNQPIQNWRADLSRFASIWITNERSKPTNQHNGTRRNDRGGSRAKTGAGDGITVKIL